ncbi:hypothetical protein J6590_043336 [Homalodisca vitripennis]|nr:hypothetical protein J6590_043336 [Homalodisca vitripennis]
MATRLIISHAELTVMVPASNSRWSVISGDYNNLRVPACSPRCPAESRGLQDAPGRRTRVGGEGAGQLSRRTAASRGGDSAVVAVLLAPHYRYNPQVGRLGRPRRGFARLFVKTSHPLALILVIDCEKE